MPRRREVRYSPGALEDLRSLFDYLAEKADFAVAERYVDRLQDYIDGFELFSERGTRRDDLRPGIRLVGFERRVAILFELTDQTVVIIAIAYGGQDIEARFPHETP